MHLLDKVIKKDIDLDLYPELKDGIEDVYNYNVGLIDIAKRIERDFLIYEKADKVFELDLKRKEIRAEGLDNLAEVESRFEIDELDKTLSDLTERMSPVKLAKSRSLP